LTRLLTSLWFNRPFIGVESLPGPCFP
jgi:hypothetical protein